jgi:hypothetical protein
MPPGDLFDYTASKAARDAGMALVLEPNVLFKDLYFTFVLHLPNGWIGTNEDIRRAWPSNYPHPHHHNAWGACANAVIRRGLLIHIDEQVHMTAKKAHARRTHLMQRVSRFGFM